MWVDHIRCCCDGGVAIPATMTVPCGPVPGITLPEPGVLIGVAVLLTAEVLLTVVLLTVVLLIVVAIEVLLTGVPIGSLGVPPVLLTGVLIGVPSAVPTGVLSAKNMHCKML